MVKAKVENLRENYKALLIGVATLLGSAGTMVYMAVDKSDPKFYLLATGALAAAIFVSVAATKVWIDLDNKTEELRDV
jgi:hypothetical protein